MEEMVEALAWEQGASDKAAAHLPSAQLVSHCDVNAAIGPGGWISCKSGHCSETQSSPPPPPPPLTPRPLAVTTQEQWLHSRTGQSG